jgi:hypothetical protein
MGDKSFFHSRAVFLLKEFILHFKICGSQRNFQQFRDGYDLQDRSFCQFIIVMEFISEDL